MTDVEVIQVVRTRLKTVGMDDAPDDPVHTHEQFWSMAGELLAENCDGGFCEGGGSA